MTAEECGGEVSKFAEYVVSGICPVARELIRVARLLPRLLACLRLLLYVVGTCGVAVVLGFRAVGYYEYLHILEQCTACPERLSAVTVYLIKSLFECHAPTL